MTKQNKILWTVSAIFILCVVALTTMLFSGPVETGRDLSTQDHLSAQADIGDVEWSMHVLDVGQGDAIFLELPDDVQMLVDGGVDDTVLSRLGETMSPWDRTIDYIVITHPHADHINGLIEVLERYDVENVVIDNVAYKSVPYDILRDRILREGSAVIDPDDGSSIIAGAVDVSIVYPRSDYELEVGDDINEKSIVLKIDDGSSSVLLTGDAGSIVEEGISELIGDIDILKVGHHGSKFGTSRGFLKVISPEVAIISAGLDNEYGHPHNSTLKRLLDFGIDIFRTDIHGTVSVEFLKDGYLIQK